MRERGRLLERLEHPVGRLVVELVGVLDDEHAPARLERRARRPGDDRLVDVADEDSGGAGGRDPGQIRMCAVRDAHRRSHGIGGAFGQQRGRERPRHGPLAAARGTAEQVCVAGSRSGRERRAEDRAGMRMGLGPVQHRRER